MKKIQAQSLISISSSVFSWVAILGLGFLSAGCLSDGHDSQPVGLTETGPVKSAGFQTRDIYDAANILADRIVQTPEIVNAKTVQFIRVDTIANETRFPELSRNDIFAEQLVTELSKRIDLRGKVAFINRQRWKELEDERRLKESGAVTGDSDVAYAGATYFLGGKFMDATTTSGKGAEVTIAYLFWLQDARTSLEVWRDSYNIKRWSQSDSVYQ